MATFIIGGDTGNIGSILAKIFHEHGTPFVVGARDPSRAPGHYKSVAFNWNDPTTFENPFKADPTVDRVYFTAPPAFKPLPIAKPFLDYAVSKGVKRFVFVGASSFKCDANGPLTSPIWHYLANLGLGYVILQPTWFTENFFTFHTHTIKNAGYFFSVKEDARIPLVSVKDVAEVAADYLTKEESLDGGLLILGPELLTYDEAAEIISEVLGKKVVHKRISEEEAVVIRAPFVGDDYASILGKLEAATVNGSEVAHFANPDAIRGKITVKEVIEANKHILL